MFGNNKPFGTSTPFGGSTFGTTNTMPFGQPSTSTGFGAKPATGNVFGGTSFGTPAQQTTGLFGATTPASGTGLFGQQSNTFGQPTSTSGGSFAFGNTSTSGGLFGGQTQPAQNTGLFGGTSQTSAFGSPRPAFGSFGTATSTGTGLFGQTANTGTALFGGFGAAAAPTNGTTVKFNPPTGTDTMMKGGVTQNINTRHQCITCMKEYENKSLEELRLEDYAANRKGSAVGMPGFGAPAAGGLFGQPTASTSGFSFGTTQSKPLFGTTTGTTNTFGTNTGLFGQTSQPQNTSLFGKTVGFGTATTSAAPAFSFGNTSTGLFGQANQQKPLFGQPTANTGLFGQPATTQPSAGFGGTGFGGFGATSQPSTGLFGPKPTGFGTTSTATTNTFSFGNPSANTGGLFGQKPAAPAFGGTTGFGTGQSFGAFGTTPSTNTGLFGQNKPLTTGFGNTGTAFGSTLGSSFGTGFGTSMGMSSNTGTGLFGNTLANKPAFNFGNTGTTGFSFGQTAASGTGFNFGANPTPNMGADPNALNQQLRAQALLAYSTSPFGDNPLFQNGFQETRKKEDLVKPTNPTAQKAVLSNHRYKVSPLPISKIKPKPLAPLANGRVSLFDGLEEDEGAGQGNTSFVPRRSFKKLVLKSPPESPSLTVMSNIITTPTKINVSTSISILRSPSKDSARDSLTEVAPLTVDISEEEENLMRPSLKAKSDTSLPSTYTKMPSLPRSPDLNDTITALHSRQPRPNNPLIRSVSLEDKEGSHTSLLSSISSTTDGESGDAVSASSRGSGFKLTNPDYYTMPTLDEVLLSQDEDGNCFVENFVIGHKSYGQVKFLDRINVANLDLDEIVVFRRKEITVYPDDANKPPVGKGLNQRAEVELKCVWPTDKTSHSPIKDPVRLALMGYREKIIQTTTRLGATFIDYKQESGSWIFQVKHFSKYGLEDSDEEQDDPKKASKLKAVPPPPGLLSKAKTTLPDQKSHSSENEIYSQMSFSMDQGDQEMRDVEDIPPPIQENILSPLQQLVTSSVESERIQGMKASFFLDDVEDAWGDQEMDSVQPIPHFSSLKLAGNFLKPVPIKKPVMPSREIDTLKNSVTFIEDQNVTMQSSITHESSIQTSKVSQSIAAVREEIWSTFPSLSPPVTVHSQTSLRKKVAPIGRKITLKPFSQSYVSKNLKNMADMSFFMGRSFRVGWASGQTLLHLGPMLNLTEPNESVVDCSIFSRVPMPTAQASLQYNPFSISISKVSVLSSGDISSNLKDNLVQMLEVQLEHSESAIEDNVPIFIPKPGIEILHAHSRLAKQHYEKMDAKDRHFAKQCHDVWELCVSLWGEIPGLEANKTVSAYAQQMARREALSSWLIKTTKDKLQSEINNIFDPSNYLSVIFSHLCGRQVSKAVFLAHESSDHCLATLLSQAEGNAIVRRLIGKQLINWEESGASSHINRLRLKLYVLLAGVMVWVTSHEVINCCENLDWRRVLALHLWYYCFPTSSINEAILNFEASFSDPDTANRYAQPPWPPYVEENWNPDLDSDHPIYDTCFHLLMLYCDRSYRLDKLLMPETYTPSHSDYRLSWLLHQSLLAVGYCHLPSDKASSLHFKFASQLETMGLWHWAIFVIFHLTSDQMREKHVKDILLRYLSLKHSDENEEKEAFLQEKLHVPSEWIYEAKAMIARSSGQFAEEAHYLLKAGCWRQSHEIIISKLASDAIINENYEYLLNFLKELAQPKRSETILDWASGGQVFLDYIYISKMVDSVVKGESSAYDVDKLKPEVISLCHRLSSLRCPSAKDRLCQSEMAKKTAILLRLVFTLQAARSGSSFSTYALAPHIQSLPMPEDYAVQELRALSHDYLAEVGAE